MLRCDHPVTDRVGPNAPVIRRMASMLASATEHERCNYVDSSCCGGNPATARRRSTLPEGHCASSGGKPRDCPRHRARQTTRSARTQRARPQTRRLGGTLGAVPRLRRQGADALLALSRTSNAATTQSQPLRSSVASAEHVGSLDGASSLATDSMRITRSRPHRFAHDSAWAA